MKITLKVTTAMLQRVRSDLARPHEFAHERVGFISASLSSAANDLWLLAREYRPVADEDYVRDPSVAVMMSAEGLRKALQWSLSERVAVLHVHSHGGRGVPGFSGIDRREQAKFVPNFFQFAPQCAHGALVLSNDSAFGHIWLNANKPYEVITDYVQVGMPVKTWRAA